MRLEVRCCCDPGRLIGTLDVPVDQVRLGQRLVFATTPSPDFLAFPRFSTSGALEAHITCEVAVFERAAGAPRTLALRLRYTDFYSAARAAKLAPPTNDEKRLLAATTELFHALFMRRVALRFVGVSVTNLEPDRRQNELFDSPANRRWYLNRGVDSVRDRYGWNAVFYGKGLQLREHYAMKPGGLVLSTPCLSR